MTPKEIAGGLNKGQTRALLAMDRVVPMEIELIGTLTALESLIEMGLASEYAPVDLFVLADLGLAVRRELESKEVQP